MSQGPKTIGPYQLGSELGRGSFGTVFKALNLDTGDFVAIKSFSLSKFTQTLESIEREISILRQLHDEHIVKYLNYFVHRDRLYLVLEYIEGGSLHDIISKFGLLPEGVIQIYLRQILLGIQYLHLQGVIHRDIKASNILITKHGSCKLADFGTSCFLKQKVEGRRATLVGSPYWMAPEIANQEESTIASDVWSLGATVFELATGKPPWSNVDPVVAMLRVSEAKCLPEMRSTTRELSPEIHDFVSKCCQRDPMARWSAKKLLDHPFLHRDFATKRYRITTIHDLREVIELANLQMTPKSPPTSPSSPPQSSSSSSSSSSPDCSTIYFATRPSRVKMGNSRLIKAPQTSLSSPLPPISSSTATYSPTERIVERVHQLVDGFGALVPILSEAQSVLSEQKDLKGIEVDKMSADEMRSLLTTLLTERSSTFTVLENLHHHSSQFETTATESFPKILDECQRLDGDRRLMIDKLKSMQTTWVPAVEYEDLSQQSAILRKIVGAYKKMERKLPSEIVATAVFNQDVSYPSISSMLSSLNTTLSKQLYFSSDPQRKGTRRSYYCILFHNFLLLYKSETDPQPTEVLHLDRFEVISFGAPSPAVSSPKERQVRKAVSDWFGTGSWEAFADARRIKLSENRKQHFLEFEFALFSADVSHIFRADSRETRDTWVRKLRTSVSWFHNDGLCQASSPS